MKSRVRGWLALVLALSFPAWSALADTTKSSLNALLKSGQSVECAFEDADENGKQSGTVFFAQGKMRGDFTMVPTEGERMTAHMIQDGDWAYTWGGPWGAKQGTKIKLSELKAGAASGRKREAVDMDEELDVDCKPWTAVSSQFAPPAGVEFMDATESLKQMRSLQEGMRGMPGGAPPAGVPPGNPKDLCAACDQAPEGVPRQQCRQALGCP